MVYEFEGKTEKEAIELAASELNLAQDQFDVEILESQKNGLFKKGFVKIRVHTEDESLKKNVETPEVKNSGGLFANTEPKSEIEQKIVEFTRTLINKMGYECTVDILFREEKKLGLRLDSDYSSILIGKKGKRLDNIQLLVNVYAAVQGYNSTRIILDIENYRLRREESLVRLAYTSADKVRTHRNSLLLEPMNPFERRLIHTTLNDISDIETKSEGDGLYKQVRIFYKGFGKGSEYGN